MLSDHQEKTSCEALEQCRSRALRLLAKKPYSGWKLKVKLREKAPDWAAEQVIEEFFQKGWLDDHEVARMRIKGWAHKGHSPSIYHQLLKQKEGIELSSTVIEEITQAEGIQEVQILRKIFDKLYADSKPPSSDYEEYRKWMARTFRGLARKGFSKDQIDHVIAGFC